MSRMDDVRSAKIEKRRSLEEVGVNVHPYVFSKTHTIAAARISMGEKVVVAGRIRSKREHGKVTFLTLSDQSDSIQIMIKEENVGSDDYLSLQNIDASDHLGISGTIITTKTGETTVEASEFTVLSKALRAVPTSWQEVEDKEVRFRKRYIDLLINPDTRRILDARWQIEKEIRRYLQDAHQFTEVETPILQPLYGGTNASPFTTHMNALDSNFYLRIAPELYLKRLIVGGYERIFELARNFRNEGIDQTHQPEFTMMEWYMTHTDYQGIMDVAEGMFKHLCQKLYGDGNLEISVGETTVDLSGDWPRITMVSALLKYNQIDVEQMNDADLQKELENHEIELTGSFSRGKAIFALFDKLTTKHLLNPTWIIDYPKEVSPLAKSHRQNAELVERFELYVGTKEMADGWSEITDALDQRARFENEQQNMREGDEEAQPLDEDFLEAMEYGMPPLGGIGIGIDRLVMFLTNTWSIKEVIAFPTLRPTPAQVAMSEKLNKSKTKKTASVPDKQGVGLEREKVVALLEEMIQNKGLRNHMIAVESCMRGLWQYFNAKNLVEETEDTWGLLGLSHDIDWERTEPTPEQHTLVATQELEKIGAPSWFTDSLRSHNFSHLEEQRAPASTMEWSLYACDHMSGIIVACALVSPDRKLSNVTLERVLKKFKEKSFAKGATREEILTGIENLSVDLETLAKVCLESMQKDAAELGL